MDENTITMDETLMAKLRTDLERRRADIQNQLAGLTGEVQTLSVDENDEGSGLSNHPADTGSDLAEQERLLTVSQDLGENLAAIDSALQRMDDGTYGICQRCGKPINPERLEAFPWVEYDIECQAIVERNRMPMANA